MRSSAAISPRRRVAIGAVLASVLALLLVVSAPAGAHVTGHHGASAKPARHPSALVHLASDGMIPTALVPTVNLARHAQALTDPGEAALAKQLAAELTKKLSPACPESTVDLGSWCAMPSIYVVPAAAVGTNNFFYATQACQSLGGYLPSAAQLIGASAILSLESTATDNPVTAIVQTNTTAAVSDLREMSSTLVTTAAGSDAAGSEGTSTAAAGNPNEGQPDPTPQPANPQPASLQYVTVYDNGNQGGFAGSEPVTQPENFRCGFAKVAGGAGESQIPIASPTPAG